MRGLVWEFSVGIGVSSDRDFLRHYAKDGEDVAVVFVRETKSGRPIRRGAEWKPRWVRFVRVERAGVEVQRFPGPKPETMLVACAWATREFGIDFWNICPINPNVLIPSRVFQRFAVDFEKYVDKFRAQWHAQHDVVSP